MTATGEVVLRRTWPQRIVVLLALGVIGGSLAAAWFVSTLYTGLAEIPRVEIGRDSFGRQILHSETPPGEPVTFLLVGTDSAAGVPAADPVLIDREIDPNGRALADSILLLRVDPVSGSAWVVSIPRDLRVEIPDAAPNKINASLLIGGPKLLTRTVSETFDLVINHYVQVDFLGFREIVDVLGGVPVWFDTPTRSPRSGLDIQTAGCRVLDGVEALQYVRARSDYQQYVDDTWVVTGRDDFSRIARQQDFLVLALDRAIDRGARSPTTMASLLDAGQDSVLLDENLTLAELLDLGQAFSDFNPENLHRFALQLDTLEDSDGAYQGEALVPGVNEEVLDIFRGAAEAVRPPDVAVSVTGADAGVLDETIEALAGDHLGFGIAGRALIASPLSETVVLHRPDQRDAAVLLARHLDPTPHVVQGGDVDGIVLAIGDDFRRVLTSEPTSRLDIEAAIVLAGAAPALPSIGELDFTATTTTPPTPEATSFAAADRTVPEGTAPLVPAPLGGDALAARRIQGRPPEGESCG
ncbi:MAG: LCP family protein [Acidimicrobiales bacterium]